ncbi:response regulator transcription factor [Endothiovibrio diazotrophicus]
MQSSPDCQPRLFLIGYPRGYRRELVDAFAQEGYAVAEYEDPRLAAEAFGHTLPDAVVVQWNTAAPLGTLEFVERYGGLLPVLVHTSHAVLIDIVRTLRAGAADYIRQPCFFPELLARVERAQAAAPRREQIAVGGVVLDVGSRVVRIGEARFQLTTREARILAALLRRPARAISRPTLLRTAGISDVKPTILESYAKQLRQKHPLLRRSLRTVYGQGYAFFPEEGGINAQG